MANPSKQRGTAWESKVIEYLIERGHDQAERRAQHGNTDRGDVSGVRDWTIENKDEAKITLSTYMEELAAEMANTGTRYGVAIVKRRRKGTREAYAVMPLWLWADVVDALGVR